MPHYDFKKDFPIAQKTEHEVAKLLEDIWGVKILEFEDTNKYDILAKFNNKNFTVEVKEDFTCEKTGNVGLEYSCREKYSGITVSKATYHIHKVHTKNYGIQFIAHKTRLLRKKVNDKKYFMTVNSGDEGSNSLNYLFKYDAFIKDAFMMNTLMK